MNCSARYTISWHRIERRTSEKEVKPKIVLKCFKFRPSPHQTELIFVNLNQTDQSNRPGQPNWKNTMWKFQDFSATQVHSVEKREILSN